MTFDYERVISTSYIHCIYSKNVNNTYFAIMKRYDLNKRPTVVIVGRAITIKRAIKEKSKELKYEAK